MPDSSILAGDHAEETGKAHERTAPPFAVPGIERVGLGIALTAFGTLDLMALREPVDFFTQPGNFLCGRGVGHGNAMVARSFAVNGKGRLEQTFHPGLLIMRERGQDGLRAVECLGRLAHRRAAQPVSEQAIIVAIETKTMT